MAYMTTCHIISNTRHFLVHNAQYIYIPLEQRDASIYPRQEHSCKSICNEDGVIMLTFSEHEAPDEQESNHEHQAAPSHDRSSTCGNLISKPNRQMAMTPSGSTIYDDLEVSSLHMALYELYYHDEYTRLRFLCTCSCGTVKFMFLEWGAVFFFCLFVMVGSS